MHRWMLAMCIEKVFTLDMLVCTLGISHHLLCISSRCIISCRLKCVAMHHAASQTPAAVSHLSARNAASNSGTSERASVSHAF